MLREVYGAFRRAFVLPAHVGEEDVSATDDAGVLTVRVAAAYGGSTVRRIPVGTPSGSAADATSQDQQAAEPAQPSDGEQAA